MMAKASNAQARSFNGQLLVSALHHTEDSRGARTGWYNLVLDVVRRRSTSELPDYAASYIPKTTFEPILCSPHDAKVATKMNCAWPEFQDIGTVARSSFQAHKYRVAIPDAHR
jgi:hypothetical protein